MEESLDPAPDAVDESEPRIRLALALVRDPAPASRVWARLEGGDVLTSIDAAMHAHGPFGASSDFRAFVAGLAAGRFLAEVAAVPAVRANPPPIREFVPPFLGDLHLAWACSRTPPEERAWLRLWRHGTPSLTRLARSIRGVAPEPEIADFLVDLWLPRDHGGSLLSTYRGLAALRSWLWLVFRRRIARRRQEPAKVEWISAAVAEASDLGGEEPADLELQARLALALSRTLDGLPERDRDLIEAHVLRGETGVDMAERHQVSPSYISRRTREVLATLRRRLAPELRRMGWEQGRTP
ncbi:MAG: hypothetical protein HZA52_02265 [Planctomycetes bacterium]|nr:hypothetical protein [Planctomycetota bacterium]